MLSASLTLTLLVDVVTLKGMFQPLKHPSHGAGEVAQKVKCLPPIRFGSSAPTNCQVIMVAHLSSQLLEGTPDTSNLARLDKIGKLWVQMSNPISVYTMERD